MTASIFTPGNTFTSRTGVRMEIVDVDGDMIYFAVSPWTVKRLRLHTFKRKCGWRGE